MKENAMKHIIVDAHARDRSRIRKYMEKLGYAAFVSECESVTQAMELILECDVDLMFLNTDLPDMCVMKFLDVLQSKVPVILTSESSEYALEAFDMDVVDYLQKPFTFERFVKAVNKCLPVFGKGTWMTLEHSVISEDAFIYVQGKDRILKIFVKDICFAESVLHELRIQTSDRQHVTQSSLEQLEQALSSWPFTRISKDLLISIPKVRAFSSTTVELGHTSLTIGPTYRERVFSILRYDWGLN
jgi:DNA-binding LytR/AlgR family response regulator